MAVIRAWRSGWGRIPAAGRVLALLAVLNALAWTFIVPPGQVPDEDQHIAYAQVVAETGKLPVDLPGRSFSPDLDTTLGALQVYQQIGRTYEPPIWSHEQESGLRDVEREHLSDVGRDAESATNNPPLYYLTTALAYRVAKGATLLDRIYMMRFVSVLFAGLTTLMAFMFVREVLPRHPWAWAVGGAVVAFQPLFAFISSGVHNDNLVNCLAAAELFAIARIFRRGLTARRGVALGGVLAAGLLTKAAMIAFIPLALWTVLVGVLRQRDEWRRAARAAAAAVATALTPIGVYLVLAHTVWHRGLYAGESGIVSAPGVAGQPFSWRELLSFDWQLMLPRLGFMTDQIPGVPIRDTFFNGLVGRFGWLDYAFSPAVDHFAEWVAAGVLALALASLVRHRSALRTRWAEALTYLAAIPAVFMVVGVAAYRARLTGIPNFEQARYALPLLGIYGLTVALAATSAGRWGRVLAAVFILAAFGHNFFAQLLTLQRYYT